MILPAGSALLLTLSLPPHPLPVLTPVAFAFLAVHLTGLPEGPTGRRKAALAGVVFGIVHGVSLLHWLPGAGVALLGVETALAASLLVWGLNGALVGIALGLVHHSMHRGGVPLPVGLAAAWIVLGWLPASIPTAGFPWLGPEAALVRHPELLGVADLVGGAGVAGLVVLAGGALGELLVRRNRRVYVGVAVAGAVAGGAVIHGLSVPAPETRSTLRVAAVSLDATPELLADPERRVAVLPGALHRLAREMPRSELDLVLWPESPSGLAGTHIETALARLWSQRLQAPVAFGVLEAESPGRGGGRPANRIRLAVPTGDGLAGPLLLVREKQRLIPLLEDPFPLPRALAPSGASSREPFLLPLTPLYGTGEADRSVSVGALICFEALFPSEALALRRTGARLLLFPMNEGWLAGRAGGLRDSARKQHEAVAVLRAVEARVPVLRSAVGGSAGSWDASGRPIPGEEHRVEGVGAVLLTELPTGAAPVPLSARGGAVSMGMIALLVLTGGWWAPRGESGRNGARTWRV